MAYDEQLAERVRHLLADEPGISERRMFGGLAFLVDGRMALAAAGDGLMVRVDPATAADLVDGRDVVPTRMRDRDLRGWLSLAPAVVAADGELSGWVARSVTHTRALPPA